MEYECANCTSATAERYTLVLSGETTLEEVPVCDACLAAFQAEEWISTTPEW